LVSIIVLVYLDVVKYYNNLSRININKPAKAALKIYMLLLKAFPKTFSLPNIAPSNLRALPLSLAKL